MNQKKGFNKQKGFKDRIVRNRYIVDKYLGFLHGRICVKLSGVGWEVLSKKVIAVDVLKEEIYVSADGLRYKDISTEVNVYDCTLSGITKEELIDIEQEVSGAYAMAGLEDMNYLNSKLTEDEELNRRYKL